MNICIDTLSNSYVLCNCVLFTQNVKDFPIFELPHTNPFIHVFIGELESYDLGRSNKTGTKPQPSWCGFGAQSVQRFTPEVNVWGWLKLLTVLALIMKPTYNSS